MTNNDQNKTDDQNSGMSPVAAAVTGAVVGAAAVGVAGAAVLSNDENRKTVEKVIDEAKDTIGEIKKDAGQKIAQGQEKVNEMATVVKDSAQNVANETK